MSKGLTILMIAHRLTTVQRCDRVIELEEGTLKRTIKQADLNLIA